MMNSLSFALSIFAVGIAMALEMMEIGIALSRLSLNVYPWVLNQNPRKTQRVTIEKKANPSVLESNGFLLKLKYLKNFPKTLAFMI